MIWAKICYRRTLVSSTKYMHLDLRCLTRPRLCELQWKRNINFGFCCFFIKNKRCFCNPCLLFRSPKELVCWWTENKRLITLMIFNWLNDNCYPLSLMFCDVCAIWTGGTQIQRQKKKSLLFPERAAVERFSEVHHGGRDYCLFCYGAIMSNKRWRAETNKLTCFSKWMSLLLYNRFHQFDVFDR